MTVAAVAESETAVAVAAAGAAVASIKRQSNGHKFEWRGLIRHWENTSNNRKSNPRQQ